MTSCTKIPHKILKKKKNNENLISFAIPHSRNIVVLMRIQNSLQILHVPHGRNFVRFTKLVGICEEDVRNVDLEEYNTGVCEEFGLYTQTQRCVVRGIAL